MRLPGVKHCHFSIVCNELPMLRQKVPFLYQHFDQLIFYDLNVLTRGPSTDGSREYLERYPDPGGKLLVCTNREATDKREMFRVGSKHVQDDVDVFWCTDCDEFFNPGLVRRVERVLAETDANSIQLRNVVFFHNENWALSTLKGFTRWWLPYPRIARHRPGTVYEHCGLASTHQPVYRLDENAGRDTLYHFAEVGEARMRFRCSVHKSPRWYERHWRTFDEHEAKRVCSESGQYGYPDMHEAGTFGVSPNPHELPEYLDVKRMMRELAQQSYLNGTVIS